MRTEQDRPVTASDCDWVMCGCVVEGWRGQVGLAGLAGDGCETLLQLGTDWAGGATRHSVMLVAAPHCFMVELYLEIIFLAVTFHFSRHAMELNLSLVNRSLVNRSCYMICHGWMGCQV